MCVCVYFRFLFLFFSFYFILFIHSFCILHFILIYIPHTPVVHCIGMYIHLVVLRFLAGVARIRMDDDMPVL
jgi:hypothetical protein